MRHPLLLNMYAMYAVPLPRVWHCLYQKGLNCCLRNSEVVVLLSIVASQELELLYFLATTIYAGFITTSFKRGIKWSMQVQTFGDMFLFFINVSHLHIILQTRNAWRSLSKGIQTITKKMYHRLNFSNIRFRRWFKTSTPTSPRCNAFFRWVFFRAAFFRWVFLGLLSSDAV